MTVEFDDAASSQPSATAEAAAPEEQNAVSEPRAEQHEPGISDATPEATECSPESLQRAEELKQQGNALYSKGDTDAAAAAYAEAVYLVPPGSPMSAVLHANLAACQLKQETYQAAVQSSTAALKANPDYLKALMRRSMAYEKLDDLDRALQDAKQVAEKDPGNVWASGVVDRLAPIVQQRQEDMKEEMLGKLKDLGNTLLGKFGMSLDNFQAQKDPATGNYSIKFQQ